MHLANLSKEHGANLHLRLGDGKKNMDKTDQQSLIL